MSCSNTHWQRKSQVREFRECNGLIIGAEMMAESITCKHVSDGDSAKIKAAMAELQLPASLQDDQLFTSVLEALKKAAQIKNRLGLIRLKIPQKSPHKLELLRHKDALPGHVVSADLIHRL